MSRLRLVIVSSLALLCAGCCTSAPDADEAAMPASDADEAVMLFSINPQKSKDGNPGTTFHGYPVLGEVTVLGGLKGEVLDALAKGMADAPGNGAKCFIPRHGVRITKAGSTVEHVICFECFWVYTHEGEKPVARSTIAKSPRATFNRVLRDAGVPLAK